MNNLLNNLPLAYDEDWDSDESLWHTKVMGEIIDLPDIPPSFYSRANPRFEQIMAALDNEHVKPNLSNFAKQWGPRPFVWYTPSAVGGPLGVGYTMYGDSDDSDEEDDGFDEDCYEYECYKKTLVGSPIAFWTWVKNKPRWWTMVDPLLYRPTIIEWDDY